MAGRTVAKWARVYLSGYDMSGYSRSIGDLRHAHEEADTTAMSDLVKSALPGAATMSVGTLNGLFDTTATSGLHVIGSATNGSRQLVTVAIGDRAAPAQGDPAFTVIANQLGYQATLDGQTAAVTIPFSDGVAADGQGGLLYATPWGRLLNANVARTGANASSGVDGAASTSLGGVLVYHITAANGTATLSVDDSADNSTFAAVSGLTTGSITMAAGTWGAVALARNATIRRYTRWQLALGTATSVTFVAVLIRPSF